MKKKIISLCLVIALVAIAVTGATFAYLQDADADANTMVAGNVYITQNETDRDGNAWADDNVVDLWPAVYYDENGVPYNGSNPTWNDTYTNAQGGEMKIWNEDAIENLVDKFISVTNDGTEDAYIRTIVLLENNAANTICEKVHCMWGNDDGQYRVWLSNPDGSDQLVEINGTTYGVVVCTYKTALAAGGTSSPSLMQVFLDPTAGNEWYDLVDEEFSILSLSQAVQAEGFDDAATALDLAFGEVTVENVANWFGGTAIDTEGADNTIAAE